MQSPWLWMTSTKGCGLSVCLDLSVTHVHRKLILIPRPKEAGPGNEASRQL